MIGMSCANCALRIENTVGKLSGVTAVTVSVMTNRAKVAVDEAINDNVGTRDIIDKVVSMGYTCQVESINGVMMNGRGMSSGGGDAQSGSSNELKAWYWPLSISILFGTIMMLMNISMNFSHDLMMAMNMPCACYGSVNVMQLSMLFLNLPIMIFVGYRYYKAAWIGAMHGAYGMDALVVVGTSISFSYSCFLLMVACDTQTIAKHVFFETSGMLLMFVTIGKFIEGKIIMVIVHCSSSLSLSSSLLPL